MALLCGMHPPFLFSGFHGRSCKWRRASSEALHCGRGDCWVFALFLSVSQGRPRQCTLFLHTLTCARTYAQEENVNPLAGCLPTLVQIPVFIGLYRSVLQLAQKDMLEESFLWIPSLQVPL